MVYAEFTPCLRMVYAEFLQSLRKVYAVVVAVWITQSLRNIYAMFTHCLRIVGTPSAGRPPPASAEYWDEDTKIMNGFVAKSFYCLYIHCV